MSTGIIKSKQPHVNKRIVQLGTNQNNHNFMAGPPQNLPMVKPCDICGDVGYKDAIRVCCRCKITREHAYCMMICDFEADSEAWICETCEEGDQIPSSNPRVSSPSPSPDASKQPNNSNARSNIRKPPRNTKVQYLSPEEAMGLESGVQKKISSSPRKSSFSSRPTINRTPPPTFTVKPVPYDGPPGFANVPSLRSLPTNSHPAKLSGYKDTQKHVVQKQSDRQGSAVGINLSSKTAQTSNATTEERNKGPPKLYRETSARTSVQPEKLPKSTVGVTENSGNGPSRSVQHSLASSSDKGPVRELGQETPVTKQPLSGKRARTNSGRENMSPGHTSPQSVQNSTPVSSDKGPVRELGQETPVTKQPLSGKRARTNSGRENMSPGHISPQSVQNSTPVSSDKGLAPQLLRDTSALVLRVDAQGESIGSQDKESMGVSLEVDKYLVNHPSEFPTWMGRFKIEDDDVVLQCRSLDKIQAHPPCKVHRQAYEMSKQLPKTLQFELRSRLNIWVNLFKDDVPGARDIALYFLSPNSSSLLSFLDKNDMLLRSQVDGAELLVFSSRRLPGDSQRINKELFLWGLFRETEDKTVPVKEEDTSEDMDIDMSGGKEVGVIDKVVPKPTKAASPHPAVSDPTPVLPSATSSLIPDEFEIGLEKCFNKFVMLKQPDNFQVKKEVESPSDW